MSSGHRSAPSPLPLRALLLPPPHSSPTRTLSQSARHTSSTPRSSFTLSTQKPTARSTPPSGGLTPRSAATRPVSAISPFSYQLDFYWFGFCCVALTHAIKVERSMGNDGLCDFGDENDQKFVIVVDNEDVDSEGDIIMAAALVTPQALAFMIRHGSGIVSVGMKEEDLERLKSQMMSLITDIEDPSTLASTMIVDARVGTSTGVSAVDRAQTILALSSPDSKPEDFRRAGHAFPLEYREGGVLNRPGHTEASVDLVRLAGLQPVSVLSTIIDPNDGSMA